MRCVFHAMGSNPADGSRCVIARELSGLPWDFRVTFDNGETIPARKCELTPLSIPVETTTGDPTNDANE
jgi:hypothetical protein